MRDSKRPLSEEIQQRHEQACLLNQDTYLDPVTSFVVFTQNYHLRRGHCCESACRHCPWQNSEMTKDQKKTSQK